MKSKNNDDKKLCKKNPGLFINFVVPSIKFDKRALEKPLFPRQSYPMQTMKFPLPMLAVMR